VTQTKLTGTRDAARRGNTVSVSTPVQRDWSVVDIMGTWATRWNVGAGLGFNFRLHHVGGGVAGKATARSAQGTSARLRRARRTFEKTFLYPR
jgi:hypothetical protein